MLRPLFYDFLKALTWVVQSTYFRRYKGHFTYPRLKGKSVIFAANHQNAFEDAIALIDTQPGRPTWLTRASMFKTAVARFWLHALYMIPIYRTRDGLRAVSKNQEIINECIRLLNEEKQPIGIFPEGNHGLPATLRPLQKGIARIAFDAASQSKNPEDLYIVPCGFSYSDPTRFRSDLLVNYGKPIPVNDYFEQWKEDPARTIRALLKEVRTNLSDVMIDIQAENYDDTYQKWKAHKTYYRSLHKEFIEDKKLIAKIESGDFTEDPVKRPSRIFQRIIGFPFYLYGLINNLPVLGLIKLLEKKITDIHFLSSIRMYGGMAIVPMVYLIQGTAFHLTLNREWWWTLIYIISIYITGCYAGDYHNLFISSKSYKR